MAVKGASHRDAQEASRPDVPNRADEGPRGPGPEATDPSSRTSPHSVTLDDELPRPKKATPIEPEPEPGERVVSPDDYRIVREYASGGLGRILEARDTRLDRVVAIKELKRQHPIARARFAREVRVTAKLQHPNIVPIHEAGRWPSGASFYSMKLVEGKTLAEAVDAARTTEQRFALLTAVVDVARAVAYAHGQRIIHRDLKPANVLVGPFGETVVIDWGLAKDLDEVDPETPTDEELGSDGGFSTRLGAIVGTPAYMPPEQATGTRVDERADVYSLGAMLYNVISGRSPYDDVPQGEVLDRVVEAPPIPLHRHAPDAPPDLLAIVDKAMSRDPGRRYKNGQQLLDELERYAAGRLVDAYDYRLSDLLLRFVRRHRAAVTTAVLAVVALVAVAALFVMEITEQRDRAHRSAESEAQARAVAERRIDELLVVKARALVDTDPTMAVAWLKNLRTISEGAATVAARAEDRGVARFVHRGHSDLVSAVALSADANLVASGGHDKNIILWNQATGQPVVLSAHSERVTGFVFSKDGRQLVSASYDGTVRLTDVETHQDRVLTRHAGPVKAIALDPSTATVASASGDGSVRITSLSGEPRAAFEAPADRELFLAFTKDGTHLLSGSHEHTVRIWSLNGGEHRTLSGHQAPVTAATLSENGRITVSASEDGTVRLWDLDDGSATVLHQDSLSMRAVALSPDGSMIAAGGQDGSVRLWDDVAQNPHGRVTSTHGERIEQLAFSPDGKRLASAGWDRAVRVLDLSTGATRTLLGHADVVSTLAFSADGNVLASGSWDKTIRVWHLEHQPAARTFRGHRVGVRSVAASPDGRWLASAGHDNTVRLWSLADRDERVLSGHTDHVYRVVFSPDGKHLASSSDDRTVRLWAVPSGASMTLRGHGADVEEIAFSPDGRYVVSASEDDTARLWNLAEKTSISLRHEGDVTAVAFSPDGTRLTTSSRDQAVRTWAMPSGELLETMREHGDEVWSVAYSSDGSRLASASVDGTVIVRPSHGGQRQVFDNLSGARLVTFDPATAHIAVAGVAPRGWFCALATGQCSELRGHRALIRDLLFVQDGELLVTGSGDATVQIWDLETRERRILQGHAAPVFDLAKLPSGEFIASAGGDAIVQVWPVRPPPETATLRAFLGDLTTETIDEAVTSVRSD